MAFIYIIQLQIPVITFKDIVQFTVKSMISVKKFMAFYLPMFLSPRITGFYVNHWSVGNSGPFMGCCIFLFSPYQPLRQLYGLLS